MNYVIFNLIIMLFLAIIYYGLFITLQLIILSISVIFDTIQSVINYIKRKIGAKRN